MKKIFVGITLLMCLLLSGVMLACGGDNSTGEGDGSASTPPTYYTLTFEKNSAVTFDSEILSGAKVREGYEVQFGITLGENVVGTPTVYVNGASVAAVDGKYSFVMSEDTTVKVAGVNKLSVYSVTFDKGTDRVEFISDNGDTEAGFEVLQGETVSFSVKISSYYKNEFEVAANTEILTPGADGKYSFTASEDVNIKVYGLEQDDNFTSRNNGKSDGSGTASDPFKISKPIDLFYMSELINNDFWAGTGYYQAYYELTNDIDMGGEQLYVIGDGTSSTAFFGGVFNGNGYTISNFYIDSVKIEQENYTGVFLPYVGMFGTMAATSYSAPKVYGLNLDSFTVNINADPYDSLFAAGGIAGMNVGGEITACSVTNATFTVNADSEYFGYVGGLVGAHQSAYSSEDVRFYSVIRSCYTDADIEIKSGIVYAAGGITGYLMSAEDKTTAFVLNSYSLGSVDGAINAGGIVGKADGNTSVIGCYSIGEITAQTEIVKTGMAAYDAYAYAYAGGIVGYVDYDSVVADCFFDGFAVAFSVNGPAYQQNGDTVGYSNVSGVPYVHVNAATVINNIGPDSGEVITDQLLKDRLNWHEADWVFSGDGYPTINYAEAHKSFTVTVSYGDKTVNGSKSDGFDVTDVYIPMSYWNIATDANGYVLPEFITADDGSRSHGYYFDRELTQRVPYSFVPTGNLTIYAGFADYSEVAGVYYVSHNGYTGVYIELTEYGELIFVDGACEVASDYIYDGERIVLRSTAIARLFDWENDAMQESAEYYYFSYAATVSDGTLVAWDNTFFIKGVNQFVALKQIEGFDCGDYYTGDGARYSFYEDGSGLLTSNDGEELHFTYSISGNQLTVTDIEGATQIGYVNDSGLPENINGKELTAVDAFAGAWEKVSTTTKQYVLSGMGEWTYTEYGYRASGEIKQLLTERGTYTVSENVAVLSDGTELTLLGEGELEVKNAGGAYTFVKQNSFFGKWLFNNAVEPVELVLEGIADGGVGSAIVTYNRSSVYDAKYEYKNGKIRIFAGDLQLAELTYNAANGTLGGVLYSEAKVSFRNDAVFCLYDEIKGDWVSDSDVIQKLSFNGLGAYNIKGSSSSIAVRGIVTVNGSRAVPYTVSRENGIVSFTYDGADYALTYDGGKQMLTLEYNGDTVQLVRYDAWASIVLYAEDESGERCELSFDGLGSLEGGGTATYTTYKSGEKVSEESVRYVSYRSSVTLFSSTDQFVISKHFDGYYAVTDVNGNVHKELYEVNAFTGTWAVSDKLDTLVIGNIGHDGIAYGSYLGEQEVFIYDQRLDILSFTLSGEKMEITALDGGSLAINSSIICMPIDEVDEFYGKHAAVDGQTSVWIDGFGNNIYRYGVISIVNGDGRVLEKYQYMFDDLGQMAVEVEPYTYELFVECKSTDGGAYKVGDKYYRLVATDVLYWVEATLNGVEFTFNGVDKLIGDNGVVYSYEIVSNDENSFTYTLNLTAADGSTHVATLDYRVAGEYTITIEEN